MLLLPTTTVTTYYNTYYRLPLLLLKTVQFDFTQNMLGLSLETSRTIKRSGEGGGRRTTEPRAS